MGIDGLTGYIKTHDEFFTKYELHGDYLVIDGHALAYELHKCCTKKKPYLYCQVNSVFGGDYDKYAHLVEEFFVQLHKCKVTPLVLMDGAMENKKMDTLHKRMQDRLDVVANYDPSTHDREHLPPIAMQVFVTTLKRRGVKVCRCLFEGDPCIAGVAKILNCPVLSRDSDFYIFGVKYISLESLYPYFARIINNRHVMPCKLFEVDNLLRSLPGLTRDVLPIVAVLQGNDYIERDTFKNFVSCFAHENPGACWKKGQENRIRIFSILVWLKNKRLDDAIAFILCTLPKKNRQNVLNQIETVINGYVDLPYEMLVPLGFEKNYQDFLKKSLHQIRFKFQGKIENLEIKQFWPEYNITENFSLEEQFEETKTQETFDRSIKDFPNTWPPWFAHHYYAADFPSSFVDLMLRRVYLETVQIENLKEPSAEAISFKIVSVIDDLLVAGRKKFRNDLLYVTREGGGYVHHHLDILHGVDSTTFPSLDKLRDLSISARKKIIDDTLGISRKGYLFDDIPEEWRLYVATILFWMEQPDRPPRNSYHMYAILFTMLMGVIDRKIGYHRSLQTLQNAYSSETKQVRSVKNSGKLNLQNEATCSMIEALEAVTKTDCSKAAPFFISNYEMDRKLCNESEKLFDVSIVHVFSQFQSCIKHAIALNTLLGYPYKTPILAELFNGTMLYNLYTKFEKQSNVEAYIAASLQRSPSLLHLLNLLIEQLKRIIVLSDKSLIFVFCGMSIHFGQMREFASILSSPEDDPSKLEKSKKHEENEEETKDSFIDDEENIEAMNEIRRLLSLKGRKIFDRNLARLNSGRGVTKRKNKKKKKRTLDEDLAAGDKALRKESTLARRSSKVVFRSEHYNLSSDEST